MAFECVHILRDFRYVCTSVSLVKHCACGYQYCFVNQPVYKLIAVAKRYGLPDGLACLVPDDGDFANVEVLLPEMFVGVLWANLLTVSSGCRDLRACVHLSGILRLRKTIGTSKTPSNIAPLTDSSATDANSRPFRS